MDSRYNKYLRLAENTYFKRLGKVVKIVGLTIESVGPDAKLNDLCRIIIDENANTVVMAEVVGFRDKRLLLMPYESVEGIGVGCIVENTGHPLSVSVGNELLGHTLDGIGRPTDIDKLETPYEYPVDAQPPDPMSRKIISEVLPLGVKAVDGLITVGKGQRIGIFAGSGVGKSTLLGMFARNTKADINVIALIGERGREVREFVERDLGEEGMKRSIVVVATSDKPALIRSNDGDIHCRVFQGSGKRCASDDGFPDTFFHGTARDRTCIRRTACNQRISAECIFGDAKTVRACRNFR